MHTSIITPAELDWTTQDGIEVPISKVFGDVYFSRKNGLAESRHVFLQANDLTQRLSHLQAHQYFCVGELGFGTGLNILTLWQLWQHCRPNNQSHLHVVTFEKFPLTKSDLQRALKAWPELKPLIDQLLLQYPPALAGCHRLIFVKERFSIDLWLGDAAINLPKIQSQHPVDAWFLDGFSPQLNPELWQAQILDEVIRLSAEGTTFSSFSVAGILKHGLRQRGIAIQRVRGFGYKREMLKAHWPIEHPPTKAILKKQPTIAIIGAGIAGLSVAHALSNRGLSVTLIDQDQPLAGASGNPRALLAPQPLAIEKFSDNLMNMGGLFSFRYWQQYPAVFSFSHILFFSEKKQQEQLDKIQDYPAEFLQVMSAEEASHYSQTNLSLPATDFKQAALLDPQALSQQVLSNPLIDVKQANIQSLKKLDSGLWALCDDKAQHVLSADHVIICNARHSHVLCPLLPTLNAIRGQVSWAKIAQPQHKLTCALSYGGYVAPITDEQQQPILLFGASFIKGDLSTDIKVDDHQHNYDLLAALAPEVAQQLPSIDNWHGRASTRAQTNDYLPIVGEMPDMPQVWTLTALGSKGFSFAPLCAEVLCAELLGEVLPISQSLAKAISPSRFVKKERERKPYYSGDKKPINP